MVTIEAFALGLPIIASRVPALQEIIEDGALGLLFAMGDADDLASKVSWAYRHPEAMRSVGVRARRVYEERYSPAVNLRHLTKIYEAAIAAARAAALARPAAG